MTKKQCDYGTWNSPISSEIVASSSIRLGALASDLEGARYWVESRPEEGGRSALVKDTRNEGMIDILPPNLSARSKVHEYGGGPLLIGEDGDVYFTNGDDQDVYLLNRDNRVERLTDEPNMRFADYSLDPGGRGLYSVTERHNGVHDSAPENFLSFIDLKGSAPQIIRQGADFYAAPRVSPDGHMIAWLEWNLPYMPWEATTLYIADIDAKGGLENIRHVAGGPGAAQFQCEWEDTGTLYFIGEDGEWSHLYAWRDGVVSQISHLESEAARPLWGLGMRSYALLGNNKVVLVTVDEGEHQLWLLDGAKNTSTRIQTGHRQIFDPVRANENAIYAVVADDHAPPAIVEITREGQSRLIHRPGDAVLNRDDISIGKTVTLKTASNETIYAVYYPPQNAACCGPEGTLPPMILSAHGGPTGCADRGLKLKVQFWTSRGFAFLDVDYRGSTGYGATYRSALQGQWGILDAADMVAAAKAVVALGLADPDALLISGGSAGGYTALMALCSSDVFRAACVSYGVADLSTLLATTHKFEAGYLYGLTGTVEGNVEPEFTDRSPLHQAREIKSPVLLLQGLDDKVVPLEQSRAMAKAIDDCGIAVSLIEFEGEGHGFRGGDTIKAALENEYAFYIEHLGLISH